MADFVSNDTASTLMLACVDDSGAAINLTNCTVKLRWLDETGVATSKDMTIVSATAGTCSYKFGGGELFAPAMAFEVEVTDAAQLKLSNVSLITVTVRPELG